MMRMMLLMKMMTTAIARLTYNNSKAELNNFYCGSGLGFIQMLKDWRDKGDFDKYEVKQG